MNARPPMTGSFCAIDYYRKDHLVVDLKGLDHECEPRANLVDPHRHYSERASVARARNLEFRIIGKSAADPVEVPAHPRGVKLTKQVLDFNPVCHDYYPRHTNAA